MLSSQPVRSYPKEKQTRSVRIKPTQRQLGNISPKVRKEVRERSGGSCEVIKKCCGAKAVEMAHIIGRKQLTHRTKAEDLLHACVPCHRWLDETPEGIKHKRKLREVTP